MKNSSSSPPGKSARLRLWSCRLLAPFAALLIRLFWLSCRVQRVIGEEHLTTLLKENQPVIPCYWHQRQLFCSYYLLRHRAGELLLGYLVSPSDDGELGAMLLRYFGARVIRGSARRTGAQAMRDLYLAVVKEGISPVMTPDGSTGPMNKFKPGPVMLAHLSGAPLIPMSYAAKKAWYLNSWDRFMIPKPFTRVVIAVGPPCYAKRSSKLQDTAPMQKEMEERLNVLGEEAAAELSGDGRERSP